uniref:Uncharacterized protein n=1 Tax=Fusarium oxysporum (strain Fo5176) TaxID=660025 RepID=A0A0D2XV80_FUSOF
MSTRSLARATRPLSAPTS